MDRNASVLNRINKLSGIYLVRKIQDVVQQDIAYRTYVVTIKKKPGMSFADQAAVVLKDVFHILQETGAVSESGYALIVRNERMQMVFYFEGYKNAMYRAWLENGVVLTDLLYREGLEQALIDAGRRSRAKPYPWWTASKRTILAKASYTAMSRSSWKQFRIFWNVQSYASREERIVYKKAPPTIWRDP